MRPGFRICDAVSNTEKQTLLRALRHAANGSAENARVMRAVAVSLRAGKAVPFFASGEKGALSADAVADEHTAFSVRCVALIERIEQE